MIGRPNLQSRVIRLDNARYRGAARITYGVSKILALIWHCTGGSDLAGAISWLNRQMKLPDGTWGPIPLKLQASYNYLIDMDGSIHRMLAPHMVAFHAGDSHWPGLVKPGGRSVNRRTVGIAFVNPDTGRVPLTPAQLESGLWLGSVLMEQSGIPAYRNLGHREVSPGRKVDPVPAVLDMGHWRAQLGAAQWPAEIQAAA